MVIIGDPNYPDIYEIHVVNKDTEKNIFLYQGSNQNRSYNRFRYETWITLKKQTPGTISVVKNALQLLTYVKQDHISWPWTRIRSKYDDRILFFSLEIVVISCHITLEEEFFTDRKFIGLMVFGFFLKFSNCSIYFNVLESWIFQVGTSRRNPKVI